MPRLPLLSCLRMFEPKRWYNRRSCYYSKSHCSPCNPHAAIANEMFPQVSWKALLL